MRVRSATFTALCVATLLAPGAPALGAPATVAIDDVTPALAEDGDAWTVSVGLTNLTTEVATVTAESDRPNCALTLGSDPAQPQATIDPARQESMQVNVPAACKADDGEFKFSVAAGDPAALEITPEVSDGASAVWWHLAVFPIGFVIFLLAGARVLKRWPPEPQPPSDDHATSPPDPASAVEKERDGWRGLSLGKKLERPLPALPATWSFKDSWATNLTVIGALLTALFGATDVVKAIIGKDADDVIALATVGSAIATGFIATGGVVMATMRDGASKMTAGGLVLAAAVTTAGALGQLWVGAVVGLDLDLGGAQYGIAVALGLAILLLFGYWWRTLTLTLDDGTEVADPVDYEKPPLTETMSAAAMIAAAIRSNGGGDTYDVDKLLREFEAARAPGDTPRHGTSPGDDPPQRRRAGVLF